MSDELEQERDEQAEGTEETTDDVTGQESENDGEVEFSDAQQEKINEIVQSRLARAREKWEGEVEREREQARREAEEQRLEDQEEYRELAEQRQERIAELEQRVSEAEAVTEENERLAAALERTLKAQREGLPEHVITLLDRLDPVEQMEYLADNAEILKKSPGGPPESPRPNEQGEMDESERAAMTARTW